MTSNGDEVYKGDRVFHRRSDDTIAGSSSTILDGIRFLVGKGFNTDTVLRMAGTNAAEVLGLEDRGLIIPDYRADLAILDADFDLLATMIDGRFA